MLLTEVLFFLSFYYTAVVEDGSVVSDARGAIFQLISSIDSGPIARETDGTYKGNVVAVPNNRVRVTSPAYWLTGEGAPDFKPNNHSYCAEQDDSYTDPKVTFNNLYAEEKNANSKKR